MGGEPLCLTHPLSFDVARKNHLKMAGEWVEGFQIKKFKFECPPAMKELQISLGEGVKQGRQGARVIPQNI